MTLEQTTRLILSAAELQDLAALQAAGEEREAALAKLGSQPPTEELRNAMVESLKAGEEARRAIRLIRQRIRNESRRLERIETGFVHALRPARKPRIDFMG
jgi:ribosome recycling factor